MTVQAADPGDLIDGFGSLAAGDFNGDGRDDLLIGAPLADGPDNKREEGGEAYVVLGDERTSAVLRLAEGGRDMTIYGAGLGDNLGTSVLAADINGDGVDDVFVGAPGVTAGADPRTDQGRVYVFFGSQALAGTIDLALEAADFVATGAEGFSRLGHALASGDVNGDGTADLIVGAPFAGREPGTPPGSPRLETGEMYVIFGSASLSGEVNIAFDQPDFWVSGQQRFGQFGAMVATGDVNSDGRDDIIIGAPQTGRATGAPAAGAAYVFFGRTDLGGRLFIGRGKADVTIHGADAGDGLGYPLAAADVNGDGVDDIVAGARTADGLGNGQLSAGEVGIWFGHEGLSGALPAPDSTIYGEGAGNILPTSLAVFDADGDGAAEIVVSSMMAPAERLGAGAVYVLSGTDAFPPKVNLAARVEALRILGARRDDRLGGALAPVQAAPEAPPSLLIQASGVDADKPDTGHVYLMRLTQR